MTTTSTFRRGDLARIHMAKKELGLDDEAYRDLLKGITGKESAANLDARERILVLQAMTRLGAKSTAKHQPFPGRPALVPIDSAGLISKIEAQLAEAKRPWEYAHATARHMFGKDKVQFCEPDELRRIVAAFTYDALRNGRYTGK
jgi:phage gp16-like protein